MWLGKDLLFWTHFEDDLVNFEDVGHISFYSFTHKFEATYVLTIWIMNHFLKVLHIYCWQNVKPWKDFISFNYLLQPSADSTKLMVKNLKSY